MNEPPVARDATFTVLEDGSIKGTLYGVDPEGDALTFSLVGCAPKMGVVTLQGQPSADSVSFVYTPEAQLSGQDSFIFLVSDGEAEAAGMVRTLNR